MRGAGQRLGAVELQASWVKAGSGSSMGRPGSQHLPRPVKVDTAQLEHRLIQVSHDRVVGRIGEMDDEWRVREGSMLFFLVTACPPSSWPVGSAADEWGGSRCMQGCGQSLHLRARRPRPR